MLVRSKFVVAALAAFALLVSQAGAATVTLTLWLNQDGPGTFNVYGEASQGDNGGIVTYGIPIVGPVLTIDHLSPRSTNLNNFEPAGFTALRTADNVPNVAATQDTITPTSNIIYGFGQVPSSFVALGMVPVGVVEQPVWGLAAPLGPLQIGALKIAKGTYNRDLGELDFGRTSVNLLADVFGGGPGSTQIVHADLVLRVIPEPATIALLGLALVGCVGWVRRRK